MTFIHANDVIHYDLKVLQFHQVSFVSCTNWMFPLILADAQRAGWHDVAFTLGWSFSFREFLFFVDLEIFFSSSAKITFVCLFGFAERQCDFSHSIYVGNDNVDGWGQVSKKNVFCARASKSSFNFNFCLFVCLFVCVCVCDSRSDRSKLLRLKYSACVDGAHCRLKSIAILRELCFLTLTRAHTQHESERRLFVRDVALGDVVTRRTTL